MLQMYCVPWLDIFVFDLLDLLLWLECFDQPHFLNGPTFGSELSGGYDGRVLDISIGVFSCFQEVFLLLEESPKPSSL